MFTMIPPFRAAWTAFLALSCVPALVASPRFDAAKGAAWSSQAIPGRDVLERAAAEAKTTSPAELYERGRAEAVFVAAQRPESEWTAWRLAHWYRLSGDTDAAARAATLVAGLASRPVPVAPEGLHVEGKYIPYPAAIAWGLLEEAPVWRENGGAADAPSRAETGAWLREYARRFQELVDRPGQVTNYTPYGLRQAASLALVLGDAGLMSRCDALARLLAYDGEFWHADLVWQEGTVSYATQVTGNLRALIPMLREGARSGLAPIDEAGLDRLAARLKRIDAAQAAFSMPDGKGIPVNDTHWTRPAGAVSRPPRTIVYPDFGHYALAGADMETHLSAPPLTGGGRYGGGHYHDSRLSFQLWAHGVELLPDAGYAFQTANHRYFHCSALAHNTAIVADAAATREKGPYGVWGGRWARSVLLGFDDGTVSGGRVSYVAAGSPGPAEEGVTRSERALLQVSTGTTEGYLLDVFWLEGGTVHETYLRQTEDEAAAQTTSAPLRPAGATMADVLGAEAKGDMAWRSLLREPMRVEGEGDFDVTWTGEESGAGVRVFLAPQAGAKSWLSRMPRLRPTGQDAKKRDDFPGWHLYRRREDAAGRATLWGAIYEPVAKGARSRIREVKWMPAEDGKSVLVRVMLDGRTDTWMLASPGASAEPEGHRLAGRAAGHVDFDNGERWRWAAAGAVLSGPDGVNVSGPALDSHRISRLAEGELVVEGEMAAPRSGWLALKFADGSGRAIRTGVARTNAGETVFELPDEAGMVIDATGARRTAFPLHAIPGEARVEALGAGFARDAPR